MCEVHEEVEAFLMPDDVIPSHRPLLIVPSSPSCHDQAKKRWRMLKNALKFEHRMNSLTKHEETFLERLKQPATIDEQNMRESDHKVRLKESILQKSKALKKHESDFLMGIVEHALISDEELHQVHKILHSDPLYKHHHHHHHDAASKEGEEKTEGGYESERRRRTSSGREMISRDASFRKELWLHYKTSRQSQQLLEFTLSPSSEIIEKPTSQTTMEEKEESAKASSLHSLPSREEEGAYTSLSAWGDYISSLTGIDTGVMNSSKEEDESPTDHHDHQNDAHQHHDHSDDPQSQQQESSPPVSILTTSADDLLEADLVLTPPIMHAIRTKLPFCVQQDSFWLKYSMDRDGASMRILMDKIRSSSRTVLAIETTNGDVLGSFTSSPWRPHGSNYYGSGEAFLWRIKQSRFTSCTTVEDQISLEKDVEIFQWSGKNRNVQLSPTMDKDMILGGGADDHHLDEEEQTTSNEGSAVGVDFGLGLTISSDLEHGFSDKCLTFDNPELVKDGMFEIANIDVWTLTPVESIALAEKLELGRQFIFDHGNFATAY